MPLEDPNELDSIDRAIRINELKEEVKELAGEDMLGWESEQCPPEIAESFWHSVLEYEKAPRTSHFQQLVQAGVELPAPETMSDAQLSAKLSETIHCLADRRVFLAHTNHLSDRELYTHLWVQTLREEIPDLPIVEDSSWHLDILGGCSEEDIQQRMRYYADENQRREWLAHFPDYEMPAHEDPPYDRDRHLPRGHFEDS